MSRVENMSGLFAASQFNGNISRWDISNVKNMTSMFSNYRFDNDLSAWNTANVENMSYMFAEADINVDLKNWKPYSLETCEDAFEYSETRTPNWAKVQGNELIKKEIETEVDTCIPKNNLKNKI